MFDSEFAEAKASHPVIELPDTSIAIFLSLVRYIYANRLPPRPVRDKLVPGLLQQAQRLGMSELSVLCQGHLASRLSVQNAIPMLDAADLYDAVPLRRAAFAFVLDNFAAVSKTLSFLQLRGDLLRHIMWRRARRRSGRSDRQALTWRAVEQGLEDADRPPDVNFAVSADDSTARDPPATTIAPSASSSSTGGAPTDVTAGQADLHPCPAARRLSTALRQAAALAGQVSDGNDSSDAAAAFAAVLTQGHAASQHRPPKRTSAQAASVSASAPVDGAAKYARDAVAESAGASQLGDRPRVVLSDGEQESDDDESVQDEGERAAGLLEEEDDAEDGENEDGEDDGVDGDGEAGVTRQQAGARMGRQVRVSHTPASGRVYRARGASSRHFRGHGNDDSNDSADSHTLASIIDTAQRRNNARLVRVAAATTAEPANDQSASPSHQS